MAPSSHSWEPPRNPGRFTAEFLKIHTRNQPTKAVAHEVNAATTYVSA
jgi:hypothetical protein